MRALGIDCGTECTGFGIVELRDHQLICVAFGAIKLSTRDSLPRRLAIVFERLAEIIREHQPNDVAIEDVFYALNA